MYKNYVYLITFNKRLKEGNKPYYYIGSKSNSTYDGEKIIDKHGKQYIGSSENELFLTDTDIKTDILFESDVYSEALAIEREMHISNNVVVDTRFINLSIATENAFTSPEYANYKHCSEGKTVRLRMDDPSVLDGTYVGVSSGYRWFNDGTRSYSIPPGIEIEERMVPGRLIDCNGENNNFYGKKHSDESISKMLETREKTYSKDPEYYMKVREEQAERMSERFAGIPKSEEHKAKIGRTGMIMLENIETKEVIRVLKSDPRAASPLWKNPQAGKVLEKMPCVHCGKMADKSNLKRWHNDNCKTNRPADDSVRV